MTGMNSKSLNIVWNLKFHQLRHFSYDGNELNTVGTGGNLIFLLKITM